DNYNLLKNSSEVQEGASERDDQIFLQASSRWTLTDRVHGFGSNARMFYERTTPSNRSMSSSKTTSQVCQLQQKIDEMKVECQQMRGESAQMREKSTKLMEKYIEVK
ncbi:hypothetical protein Ancab_013204, partial [Ancistrocladus abbreviatus]